MRIPFVTPIDYPALEPTDQVTRRAALLEAHHLLQDLNDNVMQRLFATGIGLQALVNQLGDPDLADQLRRQIADLDDTLNEIRARVFG
jgi:signal transduction histidine kinase